MDQENNKGIAFSKSLKDSTPKSQGEQWSSGPYISPMAPKIIQWVIKYSGGLIKNEKQAFYIVLGFIVLVAIISLFLIFGGGGGRKGLEKTFTPPAEAPAEKVIPPSY